MNQRRRRSSPSLDEETNIVKKVKSETINLPIFGIYFSHSSPLITPQIKFSNGILDPIFTRKIFRHFYCDLTIKFPTISEAQTVEQLIEVRKKYISEEEKEEVKLEEKNLLTKKEQNLVEAAKLLLENRFSERAIADNFGLKPNDIKSLKKRLLKTGEVLPIKNKKKKKIQPEHIEYIDELLSDEKNSILTVEDIRARLIAIYPELSDITKKCVADTLKNNNYSFKKISNRPEQRNLATVKLKRKQLIQQLVYVLYQDFDIIFIDETSFHFGEKRRYGWGKKGKKISFRKSNKSKNYSAITAITDRKILGCQLIRGGVKKEDFVGFISELFLEYQFAEANTHLIIFLDNASVHHAKYVQTHVSKKVTFLFNAGYSPMLNPIEEFFSKLKMMVRKFPTSNERELILSVESALMTFRGKDLGGYMRHTLSFVENCLLKVDLQ